MDPGRFPRARSARGGAGMTPVFHGSSDTTEMLLTGEGRNQITAKSRLAGRPYRSAATSLPIAPAKHRCCDDVPMLQAGRTFGMVPRKSAGQPLAADGWRRNGLMQPYSVRQERTAFGGYLHDYGDVGDRRVRAAFARLRRLDGAGGDGGRCRQRRACRRSPAPSRKARRPISRASTRPSPSPAPSSSSSSAFCSAGSWRSAS